MENSWEENRLRTTKLPRHRRRRIGAALPSALMVAISIAARNVVALQYAHMDVGSATVEIVVDPVSACTTDERLPARTAVGLPSVTTVGSAHNAGTVVGLQYADMDFRSRNVKNVVDLVSVPMVDGK